MSKLISSGAVAINNQRKLVENAQDNLNRVSDPNATNVTASVLPLKSGSTTGNRIVYTSSVDKLQSDIRRYNFSRAGRTEVIDNSLRTYQNILGGNDPTEFELLSKLNDLIADFGGLPNSNDVPTKISMIDKAETFAASLNNTISGIKSLRDTAHLDMLNDLKQANSSIKQLFEVNQQLHLMQENSSSMQGSRNALNLHSVRDKALADLSVMFEIKVDFARSGAANVTLVGSGKKLVSPDSYSSFSHTGNFTQEPDNMSRPEDLSINLTQINFDGRKIETSVIQGGSAGKDAIKRGKIAGYLALRDNKLADALQGVKSMQKTVAKTFNDIHNDGSTWPPATRMMGDKLGSGLEFGRLSGVMTISSLDEKGNQLRGSGGRIHERRIDLDNLRTNSGNGQVTIWDAVNEFNRVMDFSLTRERAAIGQIQFQGANPDIPNNVFASNSEFLINNMMLASTTKNDDVQNGMFSFDFDIDGNSFFDSEVEIKAVEVDGANLPGFNPANHRFTVEKDFAGRKGTEIAVGPLASGNHNVDITVVVKGENGVLHTGKVRYVVDGDNIPALNNRVQYDTNTALEGDFNGIVANQTGVGRLKFVNENNIEIAEGSNEPGRLIYESNTEEHRVAFRGSNLMSLAGLNNFFSVSGDEIKVRQDIIDDPNNIAGGQVSKATGTTVVTRVGDDKAAATVQFTDNLGVNDTITIGDTTFTLGAADIGAGLEQTINNIVNTLNIDPIISERFTASRPLGSTDTLRIEANQGGSWANTVNIAVFLNNPATQSSINGDIDVAGNNAGTLINGTDRSESRTIFNYNIGAGSVTTFERLSRLNEDVFSFDEDGFLPSSYGTLNGCMSDTLSLLVSQQVDAENENDLTQSLAERFDADFRERFGVNRQQTLLESMEFTTQLRALAQLQAQNVRLVSEIQQIIAAA